MKDVTPTIQAMLDEAERATKPPWRSKNHRICALQEGPDGPRVTIINPTGCNKATRTPQVEADNDFIAHARTNVPALCRALLEAIPYIERRRDNSIGSDKTEADNLLATITKHLEARDAK